MNIYNSKQYKILDVIKQTGDNTLLRIKCDLNPMPGQFVNVSIPGIGEAPISSASYNDKLLDLNVRIVGNVTKAMTQLKKGDEIGLRGPYGNGFPMKELKGKDLVLVGGGCGVAPLRGIIEYVDLHRKDYKDVYMFFGYRTPGDILFKDEISGWNDKYKVFLSVDQEVGANPFNCPVGFVTDNLKENKVPSNAVALMCGPPIMMTKTTEILKEKGLTEKQLYVSLERHMKCCTGKCGHCMVHGQYVCLDGPVFTYDEVKNLDE